MPCPCTLALAVRLDAGDAIADLRNRIRRLDELSSFNGARVGRFAGGRSSPASELKSTIPNPISGKVKEDFGDSTKMKTRSRFTGLAGGLVLLTTLVVPGIANTATQSAAADPTTYESIPNGEQYYDIAGNQIQAHGGYIIKNPQDGWYYWVGEDRSSNTATFAGINLYKSEDLMNWELVSAVLTPSTTDAAGNKLLAHAKVERPKILFNAATNKFVLWGHWENYTSYSPSHVVVATADAVEGPYTITSHFRPGEGSADLGFAAGSQIPNYDVAANPDGSQPTMAATIDYPMTVGSNANSGELTSFAFDVTVKAIATQTDSGATGYPLTTSLRSTVATAEYDVNSATPSTALVAPTIFPNLGSASPVLVNAADRIFITVQTPNARVFYTTNGADPVVNADGTAGANTTLYTAATAITPGLPAVPATKTFKSVSWTAAEGVSAVTAVTYKLPAAGETVPIYPPVISHPSASFPGQLTAQVKLYTVSANTKIWFTTDGLDPDPANRGENMGFGSRDYTLFQDPIHPEDAYLVSAQDHIYLRIYKLTDDFTNVVPAAAAEYDVFRGAHREAPALVREGDRIYMITSKQSGWYPNQGLYSYTDDIFPEDGTPGVWSTPQPIGDNTTFHSQPAEVLNVGSAEDPEYVYFGDRWAPAALKSSTYTFLPLSLNNATGEMSISWTPTLDIDLTAGTATGADSELLSLDKPAWGSDTAVYGSDPLNQRGPDQANDGLLYDVDDYDNVVQYFAPLQVPFDWGVDLGETYDLDRIDISAHTVGGSDAAHRYTVYGSNDNTNWTLLFDNSDNSRVGFQSNSLEGEFRYVKLHVNDVWDVAHGRSAAWEAGLHEVSVYGHEIPDPVATTIELTAPSKLSTGSSVTLDAAVDPSDATGVVSFFDGPSKIGEADVIDGHASITVDNVVTGTHTYKANFAPASRAFEASVSDPAVTRVTQPDITVSRQAGLDRYSTAVRVSQAYAPGVERVYLAVGTAYADALSAAPAAAKFGGPLLLTAADSIPSAVRTELVRLHPAEIVIVGSTASVSQAVENALEDLSFSPTVTRIGGADRFETSRLIAEDAFTSADTAYIASGMNFPDALSAGPAAARFGGPVILVYGGASTLDSATIGLLDDLGVDEVKIAGGLPSITAGIEAQLTGPLNFDVTRNAGADRYGTAVAINADEFSSADEVYLATGLGFADALAGAAVAGDRGAPLFITPRECVPASVLTAILGLHPSKVILLGGTPSLSAEVESLTVC